MYVVKFHIYSGTFRAEFDDEFDAKKCAADMSKLLYGAPVDVYYNGNVRFIYVDGKER